MFIGSQGMMDGGGMMGGWGMGLSMLVIVALIFAVGLAVGFFIGARR